MPVVLSFPAETEDFLHRDGRPRRPGSGRPSRHGRNRVERLRDTRPGAEEEIPFFLKGGRRRVVLFSFTIGLLAALCGFLFYSGIDVVAGVCLGWMKAGGRRVSPPWWFIFVSPLGAYLAALLVYRYAPEAEGHGIDAAAKAFHRHEGRIRARVPLVKGLASILTLGSGGSGGLEGPIAQMGGGIGSTLADRLRLPVPQVRNFLLAGIAGGIGAIFKAPLGGALSSVEIIYREDFESRAFIPCILASLTGYAVYRSLVPGERVLKMAGAGMAHVGELLFYLPLALMCALFARLFVRTFDSVHSLFQRLPLAREYRPPLGALVVAMLGFLFPECLGVDLKGPLKSLVAGRYTVQLILLVALAKIVATSFTIGSGGSGGVFAPCLFIGAFCGALTSKLTAALVPAGVALPTLQSFILVGMAGFFAAAAKAPMGAIVMVCEMTGSFSLFAPLALVCIIAMMLTHDVYIYKHQAQDRFDSPAHKSAFAFEILESVKVEQVYKRNRSLRTFNLRTRIRDLGEHLDDPHLAFPVPVVDDDELIVGILTLEDVQPYLARLNDVDKALSVAHLMRPPVWCVPEDTIFDAMRFMSEYYYPRLPVVHPEHPSVILGNISYKGIFATYERIISHGYVDYSFYTEIGRTADEDDEQGVS